MPRAKSKTSPERKIGEAALFLAGQHGWKKLTLEQIAKRAKLSVGQMTRYVTRKDDILPTIVCLIDDDLAKNLSPADLKSSPHDRLFEVMMARFDALQNHRAGVLAILRDISRQPQAVRLILPSHWRAIDKMLERARVDLGEMRQPLAVAALLGLYYWVLCVWQKDETEDMSKTMAAIDRGLRRLGAAAETIFR